ncbi:hypothetical protein EJ06DRAFT_479928 [Trichodelitschia bisporula]|uniref:Uncharacterized protein n=1 Tax=Trichodelitschia bisporula TaxID=703511 RepID=A0A6G1HSU9_9PEZI|nr:hypothetical protein EJ06DRAFT_479928 [Trichodelitschia bisporula]
MPAIRLPASPAGVKFAANLVDSVSRQVRVDEQWALYHYEIHALSCLACHDAYRVYKSRGQLCPEGHALAITVADLFYTRPSSDGHLKMYAHDRENYREVHIEIPSGYEQVLSLLRAVESALRRDDAFLRPKSFDSSYHVPSRQPGVHPRRDAAVRPPSPPHRTRVVAPEGARRKDKRGSLWEQDIEQLRRDEAMEKKLRYNLEVRSPSALSARRFNP